MSTREAESVRTAEETLPVEERVVNPTHAEGTGSEQNKEPPKPTGQMGELE